MLNGLFFIFSILCLACLALLKVGNGSIALTFKANDLIQDLDLLLFVNTHTHRKQVYERKKAIKETVIDNNIDYTRDSKGRFAPNVKVVQDNETSYMEALSSNFECL